MQVLEERDIIPFGKFKGKIMTTAEIGEKVRAERKRQGLTQPALAMVAGTGLRFIVDLEAGKATCQMGKALQVLSALGMNVVLSNGSVD